MSAAEHRRGVELLVRLARMVREGNEEAALELTREAFVQTHITHVVAHWLHRMATGESLARYDTSGIPVTELSPSDLPRDVCAICREDMLVSQKACSLPCRHMYHADCVAKWLHRVPVCPTCRKPLNLPACKPETGDAKTASS